MSFRFIFFWAPVLLVKIDWQSAFDCLCVGLSLPRIQDWQFRFPWSLRGWRPQVQQIQLLLCLVPQTFRGSHATGECQCHATSQRQIFHAEDYSPTPMMARSLLYKLCQHKVSSELNPSVWLQRPFVASEKICCCTNDCNCWVHRVQKFIAFETKNITHFSCFPTMNASRSCMFACFSLPFVNLFFCWSTDCFRVVIVIFSDVLRYSEVEWPMRSWCLSEWEALQGGTETQHLGHWSSWSSWSTFESLESLVGKQPS